MKVNHKFITKNNQVSFYARDELFMLVLGLKPFKPLVIGRDVFRRLKEIDHTTLRRWADKTNDIYLKRLLLNKVNIMFIK